MVLSLTNVQCRYGGRTKTAGKRFFSKRWLFIDINNYTGVSSPHHCGDAFLPIEILERQCIQQMFRQRAYEILG